EVISGAGAGGGPNITAFSIGTNNVTELLSFFAYDLRFTGGVRVAAVARDGDSHADIIAVPGAGGGPDVSSFSGLDGSRIDQFFAYDPRFTGGLFVAGGALVSQEPPPTAGR